MEQSKVIEFLSKNKEFIYGEEECSKDIINALLNVPEDFLPQLNRLPFRNPSTVWMISIFPGILGVDRFYLGDFKKGIIKYFTFGLFGIWWIKDIGSAKKRCREYNCKKLMEAIKDPSAIKTMLAKEGKMKKAFLIAKAVTPAIKQGAKDFQDSMYVK